ncbi:MAG: hypothetical protein JW927_04890 [Deltaproteobacteria bacterium]|nr:hypothetical protein [Deltaproteobacteria bacterium]
MKKIILNILILLLSTSFVYSEDKEDCKILFEELYEYTKKEVISGIDLSKCRDVVKQLKSFGYYEDIIVKDDGSSEEYELAYLYAVICEKTQPDLGIPAFIEHLKDSSNSASELLSTSFESLFRLHPEMVMDEIQKQDKTTQDYLLQKLYWGFLNNEDSEIVETIDGKTELKKYILNATNYEDTFYKVYPVLKEKHDKYKRSIEYIFENCRSYFKWAEENQKESEKK